PLDAFAALSLRASMARHLGLMLAAPGLIGRGEPLVPLLRGLPRCVRTTWLVPVLQWAWLRRLLAFLTPPVPAWVLFVTATWAWHVPAVYELTLRSPAWHRAEHACFLLTGLLFRVPVVRPVPVRPARAPV